MVRTLSGFGVSRTVSSTVTAKVPSEPMKNPRRSKPGASSPSAPRRATSPVGRTTFISMMWFVVIPYLRQCAPPEFSAALPPMVQAAWLEGSGA